MVLAAITSVAIFGKYYLNKTASVFLIFNEGANFKVKNYARNGGLKKYNIKEMDDVIAYTIFYIPPKANACEYDHPYIILTISRIDSVFSGVNASNIVESRIYNIAKARDTQINLPAPVGDKVVNLGTLNSHLYDVGYVNLSNEFAATYFRQEVENATIYSVNGVDKNIQYFFDFTIKISGRNNADCLTILTKEINREINSRITKFDM